jgi:hypothetical protein
MALNHPSWLFAAAIITLASQNPARDQAHPPEPPTGAGRISGVVVAADSGAPVKRANVAIAGVSSPPTQRPISGVTGGVIGGTVGHRSRWSKVIENSCAPSVSAVSSTSVSS